MKTRILASAVMIPMLLVVVLWAPKVVAAILVGLMGAIGSYELLYRTGLLKHLRLNIYSAIMAFFVSIWSYFGCNYPTMLLGMMVYYALMFGEMMASHVKLHIKDAFLCVLSGVIFPFLLSALIRIFVGEMGVYYVWVPFLLAFMSDIGAYFTGVFFGKHKLCPIVSPKKTVEGLVGGVVLATLSMLVYGLVLQYIFRSGVDMGLRVNFGYLLIFGILGSLGGVFGDLSLSVIKRQTGIKDYGNLIPGHGGIMDRFDSVLVTAPLTEALLLILPLVV